MQMEVWLSLQLVVGGIEVWQWVHNGIIRKYAGNTPTHFTKPRNRATSNYIPSLSPNIFIQISIYIAISQTQ